MKLRHKETGAIYESEDLQSIETFHLDQKTHLILSSYWEEIDDDWHYLELNPKDLPPTDKQVIIATETNDMIAYDTALHDDNGWFKPDGYPLKTNDNGDILYSSYIKVENVVAWKELRKIEIEI